MKKYVTATVMRAVCMNADEMGVIGAFIEEGRANGMWKRHADASDKHHIIVGSLLNGYYNLEKLVNYDSGIYQYRLIVYVYDCNEIVQMFAPVIRLSDAFTLDGYNEIRKLLDVIRKRETAINAQARL